MKKFFAMLLAVATVLSLVACGAKEEAPAETPAETPVEAPADAPAGPDDVDLKELAANYDGQIEINIWGIDSVGEDAGSRGWQWNRMCEEYAAQFDNVTINYVRQGNYNEVSGKVLAAAAAKALPTMFMAGEAGVLSFAGIAADIKDYVPSATVADYHQGLFASLYDEEGRLLAAPAARSMPFLIVNEKILAEAGWSGDQITSMDKLFECSKDVYEKTGKKGYIVYWDTDAWHWESHIYADGGDVLNPEGTAPTFGAEYDYVGAKFCERVQQGLAEGHVANPYGTPKPSDTRDLMFGNGEAAIMLRSCNGVPGVIKKMLDGGYSAEDIGTYVQPGGSEGQEPSVNGGGSNWVICDSASYEEKMIAGGLLAYMASVENVTAITKNTGSFMITNSAYNSEAGQAVLAENPWMEAIYESMPYLHARPNTTSWTEMNIYATDKLEQFCLDPANTDLHAMVDDIEAKFQQIIDDNAW